MIVSYDNLVRVSMEVIGGLFNDRRYWLNIRHGGCIKVSNVELARLLLERVGEYADGYVSEERLREVYINHVVIPYLAGFYRVRRYRHCSRNCRVTYVICK